MADDRPRAARSDPAFVWTWARGVLGPPIARRVGRAGDPAPRVTPAAVIGLNGYARTGKDAVADILVREHGFERVGFADALREVCLRVDPHINSAGERLSTLVTRLGWERAKDYYPGVRQLLQAQGVACREVLGEDVWVQALQRKLSPGKRYVIPDVRFPNELAAVREMGGLAVRVIRPGYGPVNGHISEIALDAEPMRAIVNAHDLEVLADKVRHLVPVRMDSA